MNENKIITIPAIRAHMGTWTYYVTTMTFKDIKEKVKKLRKFIRVKD